MADLFQHYADPHAIWAAGNAVQGYAGDVEDLDGGTQAAHKPAQAGVAGLLAGPMANAPTGLKTRATEWMQTSLSGGGAINYWGNAVNTYNQGVDGLNQKWQNQLNADSQETDRRAAGKVATDENNLKASLSQQQQGLEGDLDKAASTTAGYLKNPGDSATVLALFQAGAMPIAAPKAFPHVDFSSIDPRKLYDALVANGRIPPELAGMNQQQLVDYLKAHPEVADEVALLLAVPSLSGQEKGLVQALAKVDADEANQGLGTPPGQNGLNLIGLSEQRLNAINDKLAHGGTLTDGENAYLKAWLDGVGAANLARLPQYIKDATQAGATGTGSERMDLNKANLKQYAGPVADAIMNLSDPTKNPQDRQLTSDEHTYIPLDAMPQSVRDLINTPIGQRDPDTGLLWPQMDGRDPKLTGPFTVAGLSQYQGFADLLSQANAKGGDSFNYELGESAIRVKQDLNAITATVTAAAKRDPGIDLTQLQQATGDLASSEMLSVVSHNHNASSELLISDSDRRAILGMNWTNDQGAADLVHSGTDRLTSSDNKNPNEVGDPREQANAAYLVMQEIGSDPYGYQNVMRHDTHLQDAVVDTGIQWMDTFARDRGHTPEGASMMTGPDGSGSPAWGIGLNTQEQRGFLDFVAGAGAEHKVDVGGGQTITEHTGAERFGAASEIYQQSLVAQAMKNGTAADVSTALSAAGRLEGAYDEAGLDQLVHQDGKDHATKMEAWQAEVQRQHYKALGAKMLTSVVTTAGSAALGPEALAAKIAVGVGSSWAGSATGDVWDHVFAAPPQPSDPTAADSDGYRTYLDGEAPHRTDYMLVAAAHQAGVDITDPHAQAAARSLYDSQGHLKSYAEIAADPNGLNNLEQARSGEVGAWERQVQQRDPNAAYDINDGLDYDRGRQSTFDNTPNYRVGTHSAASDDHQRRQLLYGTGQIGVFDPNSPDLHGNTPADGSDPDLPTKPPGDFYPTDPDKIGHR